MLKMVSTDANIHQWLGPLDRYSLEGCPLMQSLTSGKWKKAIGWNEMGF